MTAGNGKRAEKMKWKYLDVLSVIKKSIVFMKRAFLCLAEALIIAMAKVNGDPTYKSYRNGRGLKQSVEDLLSAFGVNLTNGGGLGELEQFQNYLSDYRIIVYDALRPDRVISNGNSL